MIMIDKSEILKYITEEILDKALLKNINRLIDESIKELKIDINDNKITPSDAEKVVKYLQSSDEFKNIINKTIDSKNNKGGGFWFGVLVAGGLAYGGYEMFLERYTIEQEYAFMSLCVGEQGLEWKKERCLNKLKQCLKDDLKFKDCY